MDKIIPVKSHPRLDFQTLFAWKISPACVGQKLITQFISFSIINLTVILSLLLHLHGFVMIWVTNHRRLNHLIASFILARLIFVSFNFRDHREFSQIAKFYNKQVMTEVIKGLLQIRRTFPGVLPEALRTMLGLTSTRRRVLDS